MNKKIFTLLAAGLMGGLSVNAATNATIDAGKLHQLKIGAKYLTVDRTYNNTADSLVMGDGSTDVMSTAFKKTLWKITKTSVDNAEDPVYTLVNYATGATLSLDLTKGTSTIVAGGQSQWLVDTDGKIATIKGGKPYVVKVDGNNKITVSQEAISGGAGFEVSFPTTATTLRAEQVNGLYGSASVLNFAKSLQGNPLDGVPFQAVNEGDDNYANVLLSTGKYMVVDTTKWANSVNSNSYWKLTSDALPEEEAEDGTKATGVTADLLANGRTAEVYQFKFTLDVKNGYVITITPKAVPTYAGTDAEKGKLFCYDNDATAARQLVYGQFAGGTDVLAATSATGLEVATATFGKVTPPASLSDKYTYYVQDYNTYIHAANGSVTGDKNSDYKKYFVLNCNETATIYATSTAAIPSNMWYLEGTTIKNMINEDVVASGAIILVNEAEGLYKFNNDTVKLTQGPKIEEAQKLGYKQVTKADEVNGALSFRLVSKLADDLYVVSAKNGVLAVANSELADAQKLKVELVQHYVNDELIDFVGNGVAKPVYNITNRLRNLWVAYEGGNFVFTDEEDEAVEVSFWATGAEDQYKIVFVDGTAEKAITANASTGILYATDKCDQTVNNIFEFATKDAPTFGAPAYGHVQITTLEDDNKMIAPQLDGFAALKAEGQILKSDVYTNDTLKLWLDTAYVDEEAAAPYYYLSSSAFNEEGDLRNYLVNPANYVAALEEDDEDPFTFLPGIAGDYTAVRAAFAPASEDEHKCIVLDGDTISTKELNPAAIAFLVVPEIGDEVYNIVSALQPVNANYDPEVEGSLPYDDDAEIVYYLAQLNNVLFWTDDETKAETFVINRTTAPTANEAVEAETVKVIGGQGVVTVQGAAGKVITVANILGQTIANQVAASDNVTIAAPAGVVVVSVDGEATKVVVK